MQVTVFGTGYVGLVTGACLAEAGNDVICMDIDEARIARLQQGEIPIYEPGLEELVRNNSEAGRLRFTSDPAEAVQHGLFQFIAVGTPPGEDGSADLQQVLAVAASIARHMDDYRIVIDKSTVPVGTADKVRALMTTVLDGRGGGFDFDVVSNPEFLKEGAAIDDFMRPDRIVVGTDNPRTTELLRALYAPFNRNHDRLISMDIRSAELTKYAANALLATKISFMNELSGLAERCGADIEKVRVGIGSDSRIGYSFIYAGLGYGGSCFPKDVKALVRTAAEYGVDAALVRSVEAVNERQKRVMIDKVLAHFDGDLAGRVIALWGLAFKPNTDDLREAPSRVLIEALTAAGATVRAHDPEACAAARTLYPDRTDVVICDDAYAAADGADALVLVTEWRVFRSPDFARLKGLLKQPVLFDGRNIYDPLLLARAGFVHYGIGRGGTPH